MVNHTVLQGRLVRDVELRNTQSGLEVASFTVAWSKKYKDNETNCFLNCVAWRQTGVFVEKYVSKGQEIVVEGELTTRSYEDKQGNKRTATELVVDKVHFCGSKSDNSNSGQADNYQTDNTQNVPSQPVPQQQQPQSTNNYSSSAVEFEEVESDLDLPF